MCGVAAGFGSVFGTPLTGAIFALEVLAIGLLDMQAVVPCLIASIVGDRATRAWSIVHTVYPIGAFARLNSVGGVPHVSILLLAKISVAAVAFGLASVIFAELTHGMHRVFHRMCERPIYRPAIGGLIVIALAWFIGPDYLGLGVSADPHFPQQVSIVSCFHSGGATGWSWLWKIIFTAVTLSSGFKGGEVTPLFFVGAALGNAMARLLHAPVDLFAGLGFVAVFAGATNTPLACTIMGFELFGGGLQAGGISGGGSNDVVSSGLVIYLATACFLAYLFSGHSGIYLSQRIGRPKLHRSELGPEPSLRSTRERRPLFGRFG